MKSILFGILFIPLWVSCQITQPLRYSSLQSDLVNFLYKAGQIRDGELDDYKSGKYKILVVGIINGYQKEELVDGVYFFSTPSSHNKTFYLIIDGSKYNILDLSSRTSLDSSINTLLNFCERQKYCSSITQQYVANMITIYYNNLNFIRGKDKNCEGGVTDTHKLP